jgi:ketosteroid isomerase-like protein
MEDIGVAAVARAVEAYRKAMLGADKAQFEALCMDEISYGHTSGLLQTKVEFIASVTDGKTVWKSLTFENARNRVVGDNAISLFVWVGENESGGQTNKLKFDVVVVWKKLGSQWKMLVRQSYNKV